MTGLRRLTPGDAPRLRQFWKQHWGGEEMIVHGEIFRPDSLDGFVTEDWSGLVTCNIRGGECEIISLDSLREAHGVGSQLVDAVVNEARRQGCRRVIVSTTNDNLRALGFYQRRGFSMSALRAGAVDRARKLKPGIPTLGENDIPIHDEIELEMKL